jgi:hypothetical protein
MMLGIVVPQQLELIGLTSRKRLHQCTQELKTTLVLM